MLGVSVLPRLRDLGSGVSFLCLGALAPSSDGSTAAEVPRFRLEVTLVASIIT